MSELLSRYSQPGNLEEPRNAQELLDQQRQGDSSRPFSFAEWIKRNVGIIPGKERTQYNNYLTEWYSTRTANQVAATASIKQDYISLVRQLTVIFQEDADELFISGIDFDDPTEVEQAIPFYTKKLKEIALQLVNKREAIKKAKLKYNIVGATNALELLFYEYLLKAFTKRRFPTDELQTSVIDTTALEAIPELSAVSGPFQINIEEIYDATTYFDKDPVVPISAYYDLSAFSVIDYLTGQGIEPSFFEWLYSTGISQLCADNPLLWVVDDVLAQYQDGVPLSAVETYDSVLLNDYNRIALTRKYIGEQQYIISGGYYIPWEEDLSIALAAGNNWFYWLSGEHRDINDTSTNFDEIKLSATNLINDGAQAGLVYTDSDLVFTQRDDLLSGAWLQSSDSITVTPMMSANLRRGQHLFAYPFPGFGISGEEIEWTGRSFNNNDLTFEFLDLDIKNVIRSLYWSTSTESVCALTPLFVYDTTLIENGALAGKVFSEADQIIIRPNGAIDSINDGVFNGVQEYAWLYRMDNTDIFVQNGSNNIYWPFLNYSNNIVVNATSAQCISMDLSAISIPDYFLGSVAGNKVEASDQIYKVNAAQNGAVTNGAWLSGVQLFPTVSNTSLVSGSSQPGVTFKVNASQTTSFVWEDAIVEATDKFKGFVHLTDCPYLQQTQFSLFKERPIQDKDLAYNQWNTCTCRALFYSPFGHPGNNFDDYDRMADYMVSITDPISTFALETWRDILGKGYTTSDEFGWFNITNSPEPDVGWGQGQWLTYSGDQFLLSTDRMYLYYRSDLLRGSTEDAPFLVTKFKFDSSSQQWIKLVFDRLTEKWISAGTVSDMVLNPSDYLRYDHQSTRQLTFTADRVTTRDELVAELPDFSDLTATIGLSTGGLGTSTQPISSPEIAINALFTSLQVSDLTVLPVDYPSYTEGDVLQVSAHFADIEGYTLTSTISSVSTVNVFVYTFESNPPNFTINAPLSGWNYTTNAIDVGVAGARPFWAIAVDDTSQQTKFKGINIWGGNSVVLNDGYTFKTQPEFSNMSFESDRYLLYTRIGTSQILWEQPLEYTLASDTKRWNKLALNRTAVSNLSDILNNDVSQLIVSATYVPSDIILNVIEEEPLLINYFARTAFTWSQTLSNASLGLPPTGGVWVPIISGDLVVPLTPHAYLTNRHYPTYASAPFVGNLFTIPDVGGYFLPQMLGVSTFLSRGRTSQLDTLNTITRILSARGLEAVFQNGEIYTTDPGLTQTDQLTPVSTIKVDSSWIKDNIPEHQRAGFINAARFHQEFMPYQTKYETTKTNEHGLRRQGDGYDPWFQELDTTWENDTDFPPNKREQHNISEWYNQFRITGREIYKWKTDIYGNQYALVKELDTLSIYEKRQAQGEIWTRDARNIVSPASASMSEVYDKFTLNGNPLLSSNIYDIDIWFDIMMFWTPTVVNFAKIDFDFDTNTISTIADNIHNLWLCDGWFGGTWFFEGDKRVTVCTLISANTADAYFYPVLRDLDLETNKFSVVFDASGNTDLQLLSTLSLTSIEDPVFTYNDHRQIYNVAFIGNSPDFEGMYVVSIDISRAGDIFELTSLKAIVPVA